MRYGRCIIHTSTATHPVMIHAAAAIAILENAGLTLDQMIEFWGSMLVTDRAGNGDTWYNRQQVEAFAA